MYRPTLPGSSFAVGWTLALAFTLIGATSCGRRAPAGPNIVLIVIDTLRADHLPFYAYTRRDTAPFLSRLADRGVVFEQTVATSSWTAPSTASIHTSLYPTQHTVIEGFRAARIRNEGKHTFRINAIPEDVETIAETLKGEGYSTYAVTDNINISPFEGFDQGFDRFWYSNDDGSRSLSRILEKNRELIQSAPPYFLYVHYMDPHAPYRHRAPWYSAVGDSLQDMLAAYDSEIRAVDDAIEKTHELFGWDENTLVVVTSDHGEEFLDHGGWDHGRSLYQEVVHVPLLFWSSADSLPAQRFSARVSTIDVAPTLRAAVGLPPARNTQGLDLWTAILGDGAVPEGRGLFGDLHTGPWYGNQSRKYAIRGDLKYILTAPDDAELYDLSTDPGETADLVATRPKEASELESLLTTSESAWYTYSPVERDVDLGREQIELLRSLGYIN